MKPLLLAALCSVSTSALAFDCAKAKSVTEKAICADAELKALDDQLNSVFAARTPFKHSNMKRAQRAWLTTRDASCKGDVVCLKKLVTERISALSDQPPQFKGVQLVTISKPAVDVTYPQLTEFADEKIKARVNKAIAAEAKEWKCDEPDQTSPFVVRSEVTLLSEAVLSFTARITYDCHGAYPTDTLYRRNFDLRTGKPISTANVFGERLTPKALKTLGVEIKDDPECNGELAPDLLELYLTPNALVFMPAFPHAMEVCTREFKVPYSALKQFISPTSPVAKLAE